MTLLLTVFRIGGTAQHKVPLESGSLSQLARFFDLYVVEWNRRLSVAWLKNHLQLFLQRIATVQQPLRVWNFHFCQSFSVFSCGILVNSFHRL